MGTETREKPLEILSVEDSKADQLLISEILSGSTRRHHLSFVGDGPEAIRFLKREGPFSNAPRPDLILLDLNLPLKNGGEVLREIRGDERFREIPVIVLTTSEDLADARECRDLHVNCYIAKPRDLNKFSSVLRAIENFCDSLGAKQWVEFTPELLLKETEAQRLARRTQRDEWKWRLWELESRVAKQEEKIKHLEGKIDGAKKHPIAPVILPLPGKDVPPN